MGQRCWLDDCLRIVYPRVWAIGAADDPRAGKEKLAVLATRKFGITCPICKRFCFLGYVEIEETASVGELRSQLLHQGWKGEWARCDHLQCEGEIFCSFNLAVFPR